MNILKKVAFSSSLFIGIMLSIQAQTVQDIFYNTDYHVNWMGIDYTHVKIVGSLGQFGGNTPVSKEELKEKYFPAWNYLILDEADKYNIAGMLHRKHVNMDIDMIKKLNAKADVDSLEVKITPYYSIRDIQSFVNMYPVEDKAGIGLVFIAESMDRTAAQAYYHVVFFNRQTNEVLLHERMKGIPGGSGIRNYWAGSYYKIIETIDDSAYNKWKVKYKIKSTYTKPTPTW